MKSTLVIAFIVALVALSSALPVVEREGDTTTQITLLDLGEQEPSHSGDEVKRVARGLGFGGHGFGGHGLGGHGLGGHGLGGFGGLGGLGGHGLGGFGLHGLGGFGGFGGGFKKPWSFK